MARPTWNRTMPSHPHRTLMRHAAAEDVDAPVVAARRYDRGRGAQRGGGRVGLQPQPCRVCWRSLGPSMLPLPPHPQVFSRLFHSSGRRQLSLGRTCLRPMTSKTYLCVDKDHRQGVCILASFVPRRWPRYLEVDYPDYVNHGAIL